MKQFSSLLALAAIALTACHSQANGEEILYGPVIGGPTPALAPAPDPISGTPTPVLSGPPAPVVVHPAPPLMLQKPGIDPLALGIAPLYHKVEYEDLRHIPRGSVEKIVPVKLECKCKRGCTCLGEVCVFVKICVPPCKCERIKVGRRGNKVEYDYGDFKVEIKAKGDIVHVDYDD